MVTQTYTISTVKNAVPPKVKMSQYDSASRTIVFTVVDASGAEVSLTGKAVTVEGTRIDGHAFVVACTVSGSEVSFVETVDMTNEAGDHAAELVVRENGERLGTMNFVIGVEPAAMDENASVTPEDQSLFDQLYTSIDDAEAEIGAAKDAALQEIAQGLASGSPLVANTAAEMTDTDEVYLYTGAESGYTAGSWYYYNGTAWVVGGVYGAGTTDVTLTLAGVAADAKATGDEINGLKSALNTKADAVREYTTVTPTSTVNGKLFKFTDKSELAMSGGLYSIYDVSDITGNIHISGRNFNTNLYPLYTFFDANGVVISHYTGTNYQNITDLELNVPVDAATLYVNGQDDSNITAPPELRTYQNIDLSTVIPELIERNRLNINCFGDSTTDGAFVSGEHTADYGKAPYPARLQTILTDNGYDVVVINSGEAGERTPDCTIRVGGFPCILLEDVTIPTDNTPQPLGTNISSSRGRVFGTTIQIPLAGRDGTDFCVYFTAPAVRKSPNVFMDGLELVVSRGTSSPYPNYIAKKVNDGVETVIPKGSLLFTDDDRNSTVNVVMIGINDQYALRMSDWVTMMEKCREASNKCLIVSSWIPMFNAWYDMTGTTTAEKYAEFLNAVNPKFGIYHVDLYALWYEHALEYALASGYLTDLTAEQKTAIQNKLDNHIIPAEFTYNNTEGEQHLNEIGYHVVAMIIFDRLKRLSFI